MSQFCACGVLKFNYEENKELLRYKKLITLRWIHPFHISAVHQCWVEREVQGDEEHQQEQTVLLAPEVSAGPPEDLQYPNIPNHFILLSASVNYNVLLEGILMWQHQFLTTFSHDWHGLNFPEGRTFFRIQRQKKDTFTLNLHWRWSKAVALFHCKQLCFLPFRVC